VPISSKHAFALHISSMAASAPLTVHERRHSEAMDAAALYSCPLSQKKASLVCHWLHSVFNIHYTSQRAHTDTPVNTASESIQFAYGVLFSALALQQTHTCAHPMICGVLRMCVCASTIIKQPLAPNVLRRCKMLSCRRRRWSTDSRN
jgi:hypothetical protein